MIGRFRQTGGSPRLAEIKRFLPAGLAALAALAAFLMDLDRPLPSPAGIVLALVAVAINGLPIIWGAIKGLIQKQVNVDELVSLAIIASLIQGEYLTAAVVSLVMTLGALIEEATSQSARRAISAMVKLRPKTAVRVTQAGDEIIPAQELKSGDRVKVSPGDVFPMDGAIISGQTNVDESSMTGESLPVSKGPADEVLAGTINLNGLVVVNALKTGRDTALSRVIDLVHQAESHKPAVVRVIDRYARWFTPAILGAALLTWLLTGLIDRAVAVLIVGCPCALILAAPTAAVAALGRAARAGILVKGGAVLESAAKTTTVLFDKTGTLTLGRPRVEEVFTSAGTDQNRVLACAAAAEADCRHPLGRAVLEAAKERNLPCSGPVRFRKASAWASPLWWRVVKSRSAVWIWSSRANWKPAWKRKWKK